MSMDPNRWVKTVPFIGAKSNQGQYKLDSSRWVNTLPRKDDNTLILSDEINSNPKSSSGKKYSLIIIVFVVGLILVSVIKNGTRNLQKDISNLKASINVLKFDLHQNILEHEVLTSPENISRLAKEYLESNLVPYKKTQIKQLNEKTINLAKLPKTKHEENFMKKSKKLSSLAKLQITKKIDATKTELRKFQELYSTPEKIPIAIKIRIATAIETKKNELKKLYSSPKDSIDLVKTQRWAAFQVVKVFLGIPIVPGR